MKTLLNLSDGEFINSNREIAIMTLRENSFPESDIMCLINSHYTLMPRIKPKLTHYIYRVETFEFTTLVQWNHSQGEEIIQGCVKRTFER